MVPRELKEMIKAAVAKALREELSRLETWPRWLTLAEACRYARLSKNTLKKLI